MIKLNPKDFKHVSSNDHSTVLQHKNGHTITVAHSALSPDMQTQLKALAGAPRMAGGGDGYAQAKRSGALGSGPKVQQQLQDTATSQSPDPTTREDLPPEDTADSPQQKTAQAKFDAIRASTPSVQEPEGGTQMKDGGEVEKFMPNMMGYAAKGGDVQQSMPKGLQDNYAKGGGTCKHCGGPVHKYAEGTDNVDLTDAPGAESLPEEPGAMSKAPEDTGDTSLSTHIGKLIGQYGIKPVADEYKRKAMEYTGAAKEVLHSVGDVARGIYGGATGQDTPQPYAPSEEPTAPQDQDEMPQAPNQGPMSTPNPQMQPAQPQPQPTATPAAAQPPAEQTPIQRYQNIKDQTKNEMMQHSHEFEQDLQNGHITPETYDSLFAKKNTLGKIGTIFGMLIGGAGAGLSRQPNALLGLMQNEINNDLEAQKASKSNALNFLRINNEQQMNQAQIANIRTDTATKAYALSQAQMMQASFHKLVTETAKITDPVQKQQAQQTLGMMYQQMAGRINNIYDSAAAATAYQQMLFGGGQGGQSSEEQFARQNKGMRMLGPQGEAVAKYNEEHHIPGIQKTTSEPVTETDRKELEHYENLKKSYDDAQSFLKNNTDALGNWVGSNKAKGKALEERMVLEMGGLEDLKRFTPTEADHYKNLIPNLTGTHFTGADQTKLDQLQNELNEKRTSVYSKLGVNPPETQGQQSTIERLDPKTGKTVIYDAQTKKPIRWK